MILILNSTICDAQKSEIDKLNSIIQNLENFDGTTSNVFDKNFNDVLLLGLGEATHGTSDFFKMKNELIKYLVVKRDFRILIFEGSFTNSELINNYILHGQGDVYKAIIALGPWCWYTEEVLELIEWLKAYNKTKPTGEKVKFYGCDMQNPRPTAQSLIEDLNKEQDTNQDLITSLEWIRDMPFKSEYNKEDAHIIEATVNGLHLAFDQLATERQIIDKLILQKKRIIAQWAEISLSKGNYANMRDEFMAENCLFILEYESNKKAVLWAHNLHVAKNKESIRKVIPMGNHLKNQLNEAYFSIGFGFNSGSFTAMSENERTVIYVKDAKEGSSDFLFSQNKYATFFLDFKDIDQEHDIIPWINKKTTSRNVGERYWPRGEYIKHKLSESYDGLLFIRETEASNMLDFSLIR